ncbi:MAG: hypothetical protein K5683_02910 [Prevotella sp.]|nr:hypothetical protein [Prevotella sp.]
MEKKKEKKIELESQAKASFEEWNNVTYQIKQVIMGNFKRLMNDDGTVNSIELVGAVTALSHAVGTLIALLPEEAQEHTLKVFDLGVQQFILHSQLERISDKAQV